MVTVASVRVRTAPSITSLSLEDFGKGTVFTTAAEEYQSTDWIGIVLDGRIAYVPRYAAALRRSMAAPTASREVGLIRQAGTPAPPEPASMPSAAPMAVASAPEPRTAERAAERAPERVADRVATNEPPKAADRAAELAAERKPASPVFSTPRPAMKLTIGALASVLSVELNGMGLPHRAHVSGQALVGASYRHLGAYLAPAYGEGGGYRSTMLGGGLSLDLLRMDLLRVTALGGYTTYSETTMPADSTSLPVTQSFAGPSVGGMVSIPFLGPMRLAYRGQYVMAQFAGAPVRMRRHSVGLVF